MSKPNSNQYAYGLNQQPLLRVFTPPQVSTRAPGANNKGEIGSIWIDETTNVVYVLTSYINGVPVWTALGGAVAGGLNWNTNATAAVALATNNGYYLTNIAAITLTLPAASAVGDQIWILTADSSAVNAGIQITQGAAQTITYNELTTTAGAGNKCTILNAGVEPLEGTLQIVLHLICTVANTTWAIVNSNSVPDII